MRYGVIADDVATLGDFLGERRAGSHVFADQEKSGFRVVTVEQVEEFRRYYRIRAVVECDRNRGIVANVADRWSEQLRPRRRGAPRKCATGGAHSTGGKPCWIDQHFWLNFRMREEGPPVRGFVAAVF